MNSLQFRDSPSCPSKEKQAFRPPTPPLTHSGRQPSMDELLAKHRKEKRDLQSKITQKKKSASKKTRKGVNDECDALEAELKQRHDLEIQASSGIGDVDVPNLDDGTNDEPVGQDEGSTNGDVASKVSELSLLEDSSQKGPKKNRQKERLARRAAEQARVAEEAAVEAANMPDMKGQEQEVMEKTFKKHALREKEIRADGHCLYSAIADQLRIKGLDLKFISTDNDQEDYRTVRRVAADYITSHSDDFVPFLEEDMDSYVHKVRDTGEWGGQIELIALSKAYDLKISVVQGDGSVTEIGEGADDKNVWLAYYRHGFGLGEHYNSLRQETAAK